VAGLSQNIGVFGGTFDPPHNGHLRLAEQAVRQLGLARVLWVITPDPPHKQNRALTPLAMRLRLLEAALANHPEFEVSRVDIDRPGPQYAVDTLRLLQAQYPGVDLFYLIGGDSLHDLPAWYSPQELIRLTAGLGVLRRPGDSVDLAALERCLPGISSHIVFLDADPLDISSTKLRAAIRSGIKDQTGLPEPVWKIVLEENLYT
jgi:nicotinate-nucleotide adenylyltransferase